MATSDGTAGAGDAGALTIRHGLRAGDLGWVVARHGELYAEEFAWNLEFEALVGTVAAAFATAHDPARERCWIAELGGERVGSVFLVRQSDTVGKLRLLLVEPSARGYGVGARLVEECLAFARAVGYDTVTLWTNEVLRAARRLYGRAGFRLVHAEPYHGFGHEQVGETWEVSLRPPDESAAGGEEEAR